MKFNPSAHIDKINMNASQRITTLFLELLERQFPINENHTKVLVRSASDFAKQLNIHVNHLNRALKESTKKTTSQLISERLLQESKNLLINSHMAINDIAFALGYSEPSHFNNYFKKQSNLTPSAFRNKQ